MSVALVTGPSMVTLRSDPFTRSSFLSLPFDIHKYGSSFLDPADRAVLRIVRHQFLPIPLGLSPTPELQVACRDLYVIGCRISKYETELQSARTQCKEAEDALARVQNTWWGWFVLRLDTDHGVQGRVRRVLQRSQAFVRAAQVQQEARAHIAECAQQMTAIQGNIDFLKWQCAPQSPLRAQKARGLIVHLFEASQEAIDAIPVLRLVAGREIGGEADPLLHISELSAPIMRGVDAAGRFFFVVAAHSNGGLAGQLFFQRHAGSDMEWGATVLNLAYAGQDRADCDLAYEFRAGLLVDGAVLDIELYRALKTLLRTGAVTYEKAPPYYMADRSPIRMTWTQIPLEEFTVIKESRMLPAPPAPLNISFL